MFCNTGSEIYNIHIQEGDVADTYILPRRRGWGAALLPIALLLRWLALPAGVSQRIITEAMPTGRQKSLVNSYTKTRGLSTLIMNSVQNEVYLLFGIWVGQKSLPISNLYHKTSLLG